MSDAVVIGAGPNGLVAANVLADHGWDVLVLEAQGEPGGAVRSDDHTTPGFVYDRFSAFYPMAAASPAIRRLNLEAYGLRWRRAPVVLAHPRPDGRCATLSMDMEETTRSLETFAPGDGQGWRELYGLWERVGEHFLAAVLEPWPPVLPALRMAGALRTDLSRFMRFALLPVRRLGEETFAGEGGRLLLAGNALHSDLPPEGTGSAMFGWLLCSIGQQLGYPVPEGGSGELTGALVRRLEQVGGRVECNARVSRVMIQRGRATGVVTSDGRDIPVRRAVLADTGAPALFRELVGEEHLPPRFVADLDNFQYDNGAFKVDWALDAPIPWDAPDARRAGTVHVTGSLDDLTREGGQLATGYIPDKPYAIVGQMSVADPSRCPPGKSVVWAYAHVPQDIRGDAAGELTGKWDEAETAIFADRIERRIEALAPGFRESIAERHILSPRDLEAADENLVGGAINGGTSHLHQQLVLRPTPGLGRPATPIRSLYLASASAHPGGGVHGACGANAARAALAGERSKKLLLGAAAGAALAAGARRRR